MRTEAEMKQIMDSVLAKLAAKRQSTGLALEVSPDGYHVDEDNWMTIVIGPTNQDVRVYDYVEALGEVENGLREEGFKQVVVLPQLVPDGD
jgi:hypothetical protein